jgi:hypothetical protein
MPEYSNINNYIDDEIETFIFEVMPEFNLKEASKNPKKYIAEWDKESEKFDFEDTDEFQEILNYRIDNLLIYYSTVVDIYFNSYFSSTIQEEYDDLGADRSGDEFLVIMNIMQGQIYNWGVEHFTSRYQEFRTSRDKFHILLGYLLYKYPIDDENNELIRDALAKYYNDKTFGE